MKDHFIRIYQFNQWANGLFIEVLQGQNFKNQKILVLLAHIASAQYIWLNRLKKLEMDIPGVWEPMSFDQAKQAIEESSQMWLDFLGSDLSFEEVISYKNTKGVAFKTRLDDIIKHVANHGTHHRGQIATLLRQENIAPPASDYIFFSRNQ